MTNQYDYTSHKFVVIKHPTNTEFALGIGALKIALADVGVNQSEPSKVRTWVYGCYMDMSFEHDPEVIQVGDDENDGYTFDGDCIISVPSSWCTYLTEKEAEAHEDHYALQAQALKEEYRDASRLDPTQEPLSDDRRMLLLGYPPAPEAHMPGDEVDAPY